MPVVKKQVKKITGNPAYMMGLLQGRSYARLSSYLSDLLGNFSLSIPEWKVLGQSYEFSELRLSQLPTLMDYDPPMVTKVIKNLEKKKLLQRKASSEDERAKLVVITAKGAALIEKIDPQVKAVMRKILAGVSSTEMAAYTKVLTKILENTNS